MDHIRFARFIMWNLQLNISQCNGNAKGFESEEEM